MSILILFAATFIGSLAGFMAIRRFRAGQGKKTGVTAAAIVLARGAAVATNATQRMLDLGLGFMTVDVMEAFFYFLFGLSITAAWMLLKPSRLRWLLAALVPLALYEPLRWAVLLAALSLRRLGWW
jgi:hypothetical protein